MSNNRAIWGKLALFLGVATTLLSSCQSSDKTPNINTMGDIYVSTLPMKSIVERIVGRDFSVKVIVPEGIALEGYEATPEQLEAMGSAQILLTTGVLDFEKPLSKKIANKGRNINISKEVKRVETSDPYVWMSTANLKIIAESIYAEIEANHPDSMKYRNGYTSLQREIEQLEKVCSLRVNQSDASHIFIYKPSLTYYAEDYGFKQVVLSEINSQEEILKLAQKEGAKIILYQSGDPEQELKNIANELGAEYIDIDLMEVNPIKTIRDITRLLTNR